MWQGITANKAGGAGTEADREPWLVRPASGAAAQVCPMELSIPQIEYPTVSPIVPQIISFNQIGKSSIFFS